jgi:hypothetical protein
METKDYVIARETELPFGRAVEKARGLLQEAGYGILSEIDVKAKLEEKLGIEREPYVILGACGNRCAQVGRRPVLGHPLRAGALRLGDGGSREGDRFPRRVW